MSANTYLAISPVLPPFLLITNITNSNPMVVTVNYTNSNIPGYDNSYRYSVGQLVHLSVPQPYGMIQADQLTGKILSVNGSDLSLNIDSTQFDQYTTPSGNVPKPASISPAGSSNIYNNTTVPFHSMGNSGN